MLIGSLILSPEFSKATMCFRKTCHLFRITDEIVFLHRVRVQIKKLLQFGTMQSKLPPKT